jgi:hypothetical protein
MILGLLRLLFGRSDGREDARQTAFVRGLVLGAFVGAAIAGSRLWGRRGHRPHS